MNSLKVEGVFEASWVPLMIFLPDAIQPNRATPHGDIILVPDTLHYGTHGPMKVADVGC